MNRNYKMPAWEKKKKCLFRNSRVKEGIKMEIKKIYILMTMILPHI